jgi:hypothetical protein
VAALLHFTSDFVLTAVGFNFDFSFGFVSFVLDVLALDLDSSFAD